MLVQGRCASPPASIPLLANGGRSLSQRPGMGRHAVLFIPGIRAQIRREIVAQLDSFSPPACRCRTSTATLTIHMHPVVVAVLIDVCQRYGIRSVRLPREPLGQALRYDRRHLLRKLFEAMSFNSLSRWATPRLERAGLRHPDSHVRSAPDRPRGGGLSCFAVLAELPEGVSGIYCHPALIDDEARRWRPTDYESEQELAALTSPRVREAIDAAGIELITYRDL
mgnify:CR=1 FL=1